MRAGVTLLAVMGALGVLGCGKVGEYTSRLDDETPDKLPDPPVTLACPYCVDTAPATYTGPSNFWRGQLGLEPDCSDPTPSKGLDGFLMEPTPSVQFVRECRFTPSDTCPAEGEVCAPLPGADFQTCVHHTGDVDCPPEYSIHRETVVADAGDPFVFTLCCKEAPVPG